jgi:ribosomal protein L18E
MQDGVSLGTSGQFGGQGSAVSDFLQQNGVSAGQFRDALFASVQQSGGTGVDLSQLFENASSGQSVNVTA